MAVTPLTVAERDTLLKLVVSMFDAAPGATYLNEIAAIYMASGKDLAATAQVLGGTGVYQSVYPAFLTAEEFADRFLSTFDLQDNAVARDFVIDRFEAGVPAWQIQLAGVLELNATSAAEFAPAKAILNNKMEVASYYSITKGAAATDLSTLRGVVDGITADAASVTAAKAVIDSADAASLALTADQDQLVGTAGDDMFTASIVTASGVASATLQSFDQVSGGAGVDTLVATLNGETAAPTLTDIESVVLRSTANGSKLDLAGATGVETVTVRESTGTATVAGLGDVGALSVENQKTAVSFTGSTAALLDINLNKVGVVSETEAVQVAIDLGAAAASKATGASIVVTSSNVEIKDTVGADVLTEATVTVTGANQLKFSDGDASLTKLTVIGAGSLDLSESSFTKLATLTASEGDITFTNGNSTAVEFSATTGAGKDTLTLDGANILKVATGAGDDVVTTTLAGLGATASVDLGAGDDTLELAGAPAGGVTLAGGAGTDKLVTSEAMYSAIGAFTDEQAAKLTGFEVLEITDAALADAVSIDAGALTGLTTVRAKGVAAAGSATVSGAAANFEVVLSGDLVANSGALAVSLKDATGTGDALKFVADVAIEQNNDATVDTTAATVTLSAADVENVTFSSTGSLSADVTASAEMDDAEITLVLDDDAMVSLVLTGDQKVVFDSAATMTKLASVNASANTAGVDIDVSAHDADAAALTIKGSATASNAIVGSANADTIFGGANADEILGGAGADVITGGAGNDIFYYMAAADSSMGALDTVTDFKANTYGNGTSGAAGTGAAGDMTKWNGDVLAFNVDTGAMSKVAVGVFSNAIDASIYLQNQASATTDTFLAALDSSTGKLYLDWGSDGTADSVLALTGVTTLTAAAFTLV